MTRTGGHGVPNCQVQVFSHASQRKFQPLLPRLMSRRNAPQREHTQRRGTGQLHRDDDTEQTQVRNSHRAAPRS